VTQEPDHERKGFLVVVEAFNHEQKEFFLAIKPPDQEQDGFCP
jgi:hypothetical protein